MAEMGSKQGRKQKKSTSRAIRKIKARAPKARRVSQEERPAAKGQRPRGAFSS